MDDHQKIQRQRHGYVDKERSEELEDLNQQKRYVDELETVILPKIRLTEAEVNSTRFPSLQAFRDRIEKEKTAVMTSIPVEHGYITNHERGVSLYDNRLRAMLAESKQLLGALDEWRDHPTPDTVGRVGTASGVTADAIMKQNKAAAELNDNKKVHNTYVIQGSTTATKYGAVVPSKNQIQTNVDETLHMHHADTLTHITDMPSTFAPTVARIEKNNRVNQSTIVVVHSRDMPEHTGQSIKYQMLLSGIREVFPTIQKLSNNGSVNIQLVRVDKDGLRYDHLSHTRMTDGCTYTTCGSQSQAVNNINDSMSIINAITDIPGRDPQDNHLILSISVPGKPVIHIVDILKTRMDHLDTKLLTVSWLSYLEPVIANDGAYLSIIGVIWNPRTEAEANVVNSDIEYSRRMSYFLTKFKEMSK